MSTAFIPIAPARILEIISPAGFEQHFEELAALFAHGGPPDLSRLMTLAQKYDLELDMRQIEKMMASIISTVGYQEGELLDTRSSSGLNGPRQASSPRFSPSVEMMLAIIFPASHPFSPPIAHVRVYGATSYRREQKPDEGQDDGEHHLVLHLQG